MRIKVQGTSYLENVINTINWCLPLEELKMLISNAIDGSANFWNDKERRKLKLQIQLCTTTQGLQKYIFNSLLKFKGLGTI